MSSAIASTVGASNRIEIGKSTEKSLLHPGEEAHGDEAVTAEVEEAVLHADLVDAEQLLPDGDEALLQVVARREVLGVEVGPGEHGAAVAAGGTCLRGCRARRPARAGPARSIELT